MRPWILRIYPCGYNRRMNDAIKRTNPSDVDTATMPTLDVRTHTGKEQIRGAVRYDPKRLLAQAKLVLPFAHDESIVVYGDDEAQSAHVAAHLREGGFQNVSVLAGGFDAYKEAGLPVEEATQEQPIPGQEGAGIPRG